MYSEQRGIFKPSLKTHSMTNDVSIKRFSFAQQLRKQNQRKLIQEKAINEASSYPSLDENYASIANQFGSDYPLQREKQIMYPSLISEGQYGLTATKFDPILPKILFKRFISNEELPVNQLKKENSQILQQLKVKNINYPPEIQKLTKQAELKKIQYFAKTESSQKSEAHQNQWRQKSYRNSINQHNNKGLNKMPYFPLMGTDGKIFWSHSVDKVVFWKYRNSQIYNADVFCILSFQHQFAPISAVYATHVISPLFKNQRIILIAIAFFDQLQFFSFNIEKYESELSTVNSSYEKNDDFFKKYVEKILVKVNSNFFIQKILIQNIQSHSDPNHQTHPLVLFTDGSRDLEIVDLSNLSAFKSHNQYNLLLRKQKRKQNQNQNEIIKLLHCRDQISPEIHYAFVLRKQTVESQVKPQTLIEKIKNILTFTKKYQKSEQMLLSIYEWNQKELKNQTLWKQFWNPIRIKKIKQISSKDLENRLKLNFFEFSKLNANSQFLIADISLAQKPKNYSIFQEEPKSSCFLKVTFINGTSVTISNFRTLTYVSKVKVNPYIESSLPILSCQYQNYRTILQKGHHLLSQQQIKNKFNLYIYEPVEIEKQPKYSFIDPVVSESNDLLICEDKLIYKDDDQIMYKFHESNSRKRINEISMGRMGEKKSFMIFENSFITLVRTPNVAQNLLVLGQLLQRCPSGKDKIRSYSRSLIEDMCQSSRVCFLKSAIQLLISIQASGKTTKQSNPTRMVFDELVREFYGKQKRMEIDDTTYLQDKDHSKHLSEEVYNYECEVGKQGYQNFVEFLLGSQIANKQRQYLKDRNVSYNGQNLLLKVTQKTVSFIQDLLIDQSLVEIPSKPIIKPMRSSLLDKFYADFSINEEGYLQNLVQRMSEVNESYLAGAFSKLVVDLIRPLLNLSYQHYHHIKANITYILEALDLIKQFIDKFIRYSTLKNIQSSLFSEMLLLIKSLQNSLPKLSLLIKLFDSLSEVHFYNTPSIIIPPRNNITLLNFLFKIDPKQTLTEITVEKLFEQNSLLLDEIQQKLPELNEIKYLRYFTGWRKINSMFLQNMKKETDIKKPIESRWIFNIFSQNTSLKTNEAFTSVFPYQTEFLNRQDNKARQKEEFIEIEKALSEYSYEDFEKYFIIKHQFVNFANIVLSKIYYLQINYLQLKNKYQFQDGSYDTFQSFHSHSLPHQQSAQNDLKKRNLSVNQIQRSNQKPQLSSFLKYEQKVHNHQKYLRIYKLIQFLNSKLSIFIAKALDIYHQQTIKSSKNLLSSSSSYNLKSTLLNHSNHQYQTVENEGSHYLIGQQIQNLVDLLMQKGSQFIKNQLENKIKLSPLSNKFLTKNSINPIFPQFQKEGINFYDDKTYLVRDQPKLLTEAEKQQIGLENEHKNMYLQRMQEKITIDIASQFKFQVNKNWMKNHNKNSALNLQSYF